MPMEYRRVGSNEWVLSGSTSGSIGRPCLSVEISNQSKSAISPDIFELNQWSNLIGVHDGSKMILYMDGAKVAENLDATGIVNETGSNLFFGKYRDSNPIFLIFQLMMSVSTIVHYLRRKFVAL